MPTIFCGRFILSGTFDENKILKEAVKFFPANQPLKKGKLYRKIAIYTTTPRFGIVVDEKIRKKCNIVLLNSKNFPADSDPEDDLFRFLVFTFLHECAHITGITSEFDADLQAIKWFNEYVIKNDVRCPKFSPNEKSRLEDFVLGRDWVLASKKGDISGNISASIGKNLVETFFNVCEAKGTFVSPVIRTLIEKYVADADSVDTADSGD